MTHFRPAWQPCLSFHPLLICMMFTFATFALSSTSASALLPSEMSLHQSEISPYPSASASPSRSPQPGIITLTFENSDYLETMSGSSIPIMWRRCTSVRNLSASKGTYLSPELNSCMVNCLSHLLGLPCNRNNWLGWAYNSPRSETCAVSNCSATVTNLPVREIRNPVKTRTIPFYKSAKSTPTPRIDIINLSFENSIHYETLSGGSVPMMWRRCTAADNTGSLKGTYLSSELNSCMKNCLSHLLGLPCDRSNWMQWAYNFPSSEFCAESNCSAKPTNLPVREISNPVKTTTVPLYKATTSSPTASPSPISVGSATPTPSPVRLPDDFVLSDKKAPNDTALVVANILEVEIERALDDELGTVGSDVRTIVRIRTRESTTIVSRLFITGVAARPEKLCLPGKNCRVQVVVWSNSSLDEDVIEKAGAKLRNSPGFENIFKIKKRTIKIKRKKKGKQYIVTIKFASKYLKIINSLV